MTHPDFDFSLVWSDIEAAKQMSGDTLFAGETFLPEFSLVDRELQRVRGNVFSGHHIFLKRVADLTAGSRIRKQGES